MAKVGASQVVEAATPPASEDAEAGPVGVATPPAPAAERAPAFEAEASPEQPAPGPSVESYSPPAAFCLNLSWDNLNPELSNLMAGTVVDTLFAEEDDSEDSPEKQYVLNVVRTSPAKAAVGSEPDAGAEGPVASASPASDRNSSDVSLRPDTSSILTVSTSSLDADASSRSKTEPEPVVVHDVKIVHPTTDAGEVEEAAPVVVLHVEIVHPAAAEAGDGVAKGREVASPAAAASPTLVAPAAEKWAKDLKYWRKLCNQVESVLVEGSNSGDPIAESIKERLFWCQKEMMKALLELETQKTFPETIGVMTASVESLTG